MPDKPHRLVLRHYWSNKILIFCLAVGLVLMGQVVFQLFYPTDRLTAKTEIDGHDYSDWRMDDVVASLDEKYKSLLVDVRYGETGVVTRVDLATIGIGTENNSRVEGANYTWYRRIMPLSIFWNYRFNDISPPQYTYDQEKISDYWQQNCIVPYRDASIQYVDNILEVVDAAKGAECSIDESVGSTLSFRPALDNTSLTVTAQSTDYEVSLAAAAEYRDSILYLTRNGFELNHGGSKTTIPQNMILSWMDFEVTDGQLGFSLNPLKATSDLNKYFTLLGTDDLQSIITGSTSGVVSKVDITNDRLNVTSTLKKIELALDNGLTVADIATYAVVTSNYRGGIRGIPVDENLSSKIEEYMKSLEGRYGVSYIELSDDLVRKASFGGTEVFTAASTYKLFVAYSALKRIESGEWHWNDSTVGGMDLATCFDKMISFSDNACAQFMLYKIGHATVMDEARAIGCADTVFSDAQGNSTTAEDLALFLGKLQAGQILANQASRDVLIDAMKGNIYRQGVPKGVPDAVVADKVGFLDGLLHDASIVYGKDFTYVLIILTDGSNWGEIAGIAAHIESLRASL
jgi:beta-lactamase class A